MKTTPPFLPAYALETVPRYTSYPPATHFHNGIGQADWQSWIQALPQRARLSLYIHIPFCKTMCWYCGCNTTIPNKDSRVARYLEALGAEISNRAADTPDRARVHHIHFGGGSPDMLSPERFMAIMDNIRTNFSVAETAEIAVELDPRGVNDALVSALSASGVTRASLGVQDLSEEVQTLIHRIQPEKTVQSAVERLRAAGITAINLDIMYGLPAQTVERVRQTAQAIITMQPDRVAVFGYAHVPWFKKHQKAIPEDRLPGAKDRFEQMMAAAETLAQAGYRAIGFDHFAKPDDPLSRTAEIGTLKRNFQGYTDDDYDALIGFGASSISDTKAGFIQNQPDPARYCTAIEDRQPPIVRGIARNADERVIGERIEALLCNFELSLPDRTLKWAEQRMGDVIADGLVEIDGNWLKVTPSGRPYVRNIAARLDPAFSHEAGRHSHAV